MPDYAKMYAIVCAAASEAVESLEMPDGAPLARTILLRALAAAEELYIQAEQPTA